jgi:hypothetical protein
METQTVIYSDLQMDFQKEILKEKPKEICLGKHSVT